MNLVLLRVIGLLVLATLVLGLPFAISRWGGWGLIVTVQLLFLLTLTQATIAAIALTRAGAGLRSAVGASLRFLWPFSAPQAAGLVQERIVAGVSPLVAAHRLLGEDEFLRSLRPLVYDTLRIGASGDDGRVLLKLCDSTRLDAFLKRPPFANVGNPFCPRCAMAYRAGVRDCSDCQGVALETAPPYKRIRDRRRRSEVSSGAIMNRFHVVLGSALAVATIAATRMGGWAVVTVENPPDYLVAGKPTELTFTVRQHGMTLLGDLSPRIEANGASRRVNGSAWKTERQGTYRGTITVPDTGVWQITVQSGFGRSKGTLLPMRAVDSPARTPAPLAQPERGRRLFAAKGCITCHVHGGVQLATEVQVGPDLTDRRFPADYLARFLADPTIKPSVNGKEMPNLELKQTEIASLVAFINSERRLTSR